MTYVSVSCDLKIDTIVGKIYVCDQTVIILGNSWQFSCCVLFKHRFLDFECALSVYIDFGP